MSDPVLNSRLESLAVQAEQLPAFSALKLLRIKRDVTEILGLIGRGGFFAEYTRHDISHIDAMLDHVEWLIPEDTWSRLTPADGALLALAVYFHDLGML